jgi:acetyl-CoA synthetase
MRDAAEDAYQEFLRARNFLLCHRDDYETAYREFRWPVLDRFNWALDYFDRIASGNPRPALRILRQGEANSISFAEMSESSNRLANYLRSIGVRRSDTVLIMLGNEPALWLATLAAIKLGAIIVPTSHLITENELADRMTRGRVTHVITRPAEANKFSGFTATFTGICVGEAPGWLRFDDYGTASPLFVPSGETRAQDSLFLYFTSGTTAQPKLVMHSHVSYPVGSLSTMYWIGVQPGDLHFNISSPGWAKHAWSSFFAPWNAEACVLAADLPRFSAKAILQILEGNAVTSLCAPPTVWRMLVQEEFASCRTQLREVVSAGEPLNPEIIERVRTAWGLVIRDGYGQTETTAQIGNTPGQKVENGSMGKPLPGFRIRILEERQNEILDETGDDRCEGELAVALDPPPVGLMLGYLQRDGSVTFPQTAVYRTGDLAGVDGEGRVTFIGRTDDVFKASDYRISPFELESMLLEHPSVAEAAVVPAPHALRTSVPKAFIRLAEGCLPDHASALRIFEHTRRRTAPFKRVRRLQFCDLPKTTSGKIIRAELRRLEASREGERQENEFWESDFPELQS